MWKHVRANLWLLSLSLLLCSVVYPFALWAIGQSVFPTQAEGSLIHDRDGKVIGSRLIAQPFTGNEYFQPRPSSPSYKADASGASNWGANNPLLRDRVARQLGPLIKYRSGQPVGPDVERWFKQQPAGFVAQWAGDHSALAEQWIKDNTDAAALWLGKDVGAVTSDTGGVAKAFFAGFSRRHPGAWPSVEDIKTPDGAAVKKVKPVTEGSDIQAYFFDLWLQANPAAELERVPADMVMASGSGLDPHITLKNALYQLDRVAAAWAEKTGQDKGKVRDEITDLLHQKAEAPLGGLVGGMLVNVLETNLALRDRYGGSASVAK